MSMVTGCRVFLASTHLFFAVAGVGLLCILAVWGRGVWVARARRRRWAVEPVSAERQKAMRVQVELFRRLPDPLWEQLLPIVQVFQRQVNWEACGGLAKVTQDMRDVISAQAALLVVGNGQPLYPRLRSILVYPEAYSTVNEETGSRDVRLGESWQTGSVILSWRGVVSGGQDADDGFNLVIHEFAHQLDQVNGAADGLPELSKSEALREWARVFSEGYAHYTARVERGDKVPIDTYAATNEAEFFAVLSEVFFERPHVLSKEYPQIYRAMQGFYGLDPSHW